MSIDFSTYKNLLIDKIPDVNYYKSKLSELSSNWTTLNLLNQINENNTNIEATQNEFGNLAESLIDNLIIETLKQLSNELNSKSQVVVDIVIRNLFERTADIGFLATDDSIRDFIRKSKMVLEERTIYYTFNENSQICRHCPEPFANECKKNDNSNEMDFLKNILCKNNFPLEKEKIENELIILKKDIRQRFEEYVLKYSVYYDVILTDTKGNVLVNLDLNNKILKTNDSIVSEAINTDKDYVEKLGKSDLRADKETILTYSFKVTQNNSKDSEVIGVLILCFDFEGEMDNIFSALKQTNENLNLMLLDKNGYVISTSNRLNMPISTKMQKVLDKDFEILDFYGRKYLVKSANTKGYQGYFGLEWLGHVMICLDEAFTKSCNNILEKIDYQVFDNIMYSSSLFSEELQNIPKRAKKIQDDLNRTVWNGNLKQQTNIAKKLLNQLSNIGENTKLVFNHSIDTLYDTVLQTILNIVSFQAYLAIDIMDRNLYERANDCRWWALTPKFRKTLSKENYDKQELKEMSEILSYINNLYTVYTNIFIYNKFGEIIAVSNKNYNHLIHYILNEDWVKETLGIKNNQKYSVSKFEKSRLYDDNYTYIYGAPIFSFNNVDVVGGIGIVFDSTPQFKAILEDILPKNQNKSFSVFTDSEKNIISSTNSDYEIGSVLKINNDFFTIKNGESHSQIIELNNCYYAVGARCSSGYREYKTSDGYKNDILSFVFTFLCEKNEISKLKNFKYFNNINYEKNGSEIIEYGTFFIKNYWYGINTKELVGAVGIENLQYNSQKNVILGRIFYENILVEVIDLHKYLNIENKENEQQIVIFKVENQNKDVYLGIVVDALGAIVEIPISNIQKSESLHFKTDYFVKEICKPPKDNNTLLSIIDLKELFKNLSPYQN